MEQNVEIEINDYTFEIECFIEGGQDITPQDIKIPVNGESIPVSKGFYDWMIENYFDTILELVIDKLIDMGEIAKEESMKWWEI